MTINERTINNGRGSSEATEDLLRGPDTTSRPPGKQAKMEVVSGPLTLMLRTIYERPDDTDTRLLFADLLATRGPLAEPEPAPSLAIVRGRQWPFIDERWQWPMCLIHLERHLKIRAGRGSPGVFARTCGASAPGLADAFLQYALPVGLDGSPAYDPPNGPFSRLGFAQVETMGAVCGESRIPFGRLIDAAPAMQARYRLPVTVGRETTHVPGGSRVWVWLWPSLGKIEGDPRSPYIPSIGPGFWTKDNKQPERKPKRTRRARPRYPW